MILVLNDIHYDPNITLPCTFMNCSDMGVFDHTDSPLKLIEAVLDKAESQIKKENDEEPLNAIIITGDFIKHRFSIGTDGITI